MFLLKLSHKLNWLLELMRDPWLWKMHYIRYFESRGEVNKSSFSFSLFLIEFRVTSLRSQVQRQVFWRNNIHFERMLVFVQGCEKTPNSSGNKSKQQKLTNNSNKKTPPKQITSQQPKQNKEIWHFSCVTILFSRTLSFKDPYRNWEFWVVRKQPSKKIEIIKN